MAFPSPVNLPWNAFVQVPVVFFDVFCFGGEVVVKKVEGGRYHTLRIQSYSQMIIGDD